MVKKFISATPYKEAKKNIVAINVRQKIIGVIVKKNEKLWKSKFPLIIMLKELIKYIWENRHEKK